MRQSRQRPAFLYNAWAAFLLSAALLAGLIGLLVWNPSFEGPATLTVYCAAGLKAPVEAVAREYEKEYGVRVQLQYGGSQTLLAGMQISKRGDLYIPADDYYIRLAKEKGLIDEVLPLAEMTPVIAVAKGNPKRIDSLEQLLSGSFRVALADPNAAAVGKLTQAALTSLQWEQLKKRSVSKLTVNDAANDILVGAADAAVVWDATVSQYAGLEAVASPLLARKKAHVGACVLRASKDPTAALRFARYLAARDRGLEQFKRSGFRPAEGDVWARMPELKLFAGAMLRPAIEDTIKAFEKREGVRVIQVYNGCGLLVAQMRATKDENKLPDAYFACEKSFMNQVHDLFLEPTDISSNHLVIVVKKGNPHGITTLDDLGKEGLRIGVGHENQCALGAITRETLVQGKLYKQVRKNVKVETPTGDNLVNQLRTGALDAVIAYISNTAGLKDIEVYAIEGIPCANAIQPWAVGKESQHKQLANRLLTAIRSSRERFESYGFGWKDGK